MSNTWEERKLVVLGRERKAHVLWWESKRKAEPWNPSKRQEIWNDRKALLKAAEEGEICFKFLLTFPTRRSPSGYAFTSDPPKSQLWKMERLSLLEYIDLADQFGFPFPGNFNPAIGYHSPQICFNIKGFWEEIVPAITTWKMEDKLLLMNIDKSQLVFELKRGSKLTLDQQDQIQTINEKYFDIRYEIEFLYEDDQKAGIERSESELIQICRRNVLADRHQKQYLALGYGDF